MDHPGLLPVPNPVAWEDFLGIDGLDIYWYAIMLTGGIVCGTMLAYMRAPKKGLDPERVLDLVLYCVPVSVVGARAYYVIFSWKDYAGDLMKMLNIRGGGLAIHGALIGGLGMGIYLLRKWKDAPSAWLDLVMPSLALGQAIGRWGNYFNSEAHGGPTDLPWAIWADGHLVHPTFLYESIWCLLLCLFLLRIDTRPGFTYKQTSLYLMLYGVERFFVEGLRTDSLMIGSFRQAQLISAAGILIGAVLYIRGKRAASGETQEETR